MIKENKNHITTELKNITNTDNEQTQKSRLAGKTCKCLEKTSRKYYWASE